MATTTLVDVYKGKAERQYAALPARLIETMSSVMPQIPALLPSDIPVEQFRAALFLELSRPTPPQRTGLAECSLVSLRDCAIKAAMYGLLPGRDCHFLPFRERKGSQVQATFVPNYFGLILSLERTGKVAKAFAHPVYSGDDFSVDYLSEVYRHVPAVVRGKQPGSLRFFYGSVRMKDGTVHLEGMDESQIDAVRRRAPAHEQGPWVDDFLMMARKTALKRTMKYVRLTPGAQQMLDEDDARLRLDIPEERHHDNIVALYGDVVDPTAPTLPAAPRPAEVTPPATPTAPAGEAGLAYIAQIEAAIFASGQDVEHTWTWAERRLNKQRHVFSVEDYTFVLEAVRKAASLRETPPQAHQETQEGQEAAPAQVQAEPAARDEGEQADLWTQEEEAERRQQGEEARAEEYGE